MFRAIAFSIIMLYTPLLLAERYYVVDGIILVNSDSGHCISDIPDGLKPFLSAGLLKEMAVAHLRSYSGVRIGIIKDGEPEPRCSGAKYLLSSPSWYDDTPILAVPGVVPLTRPAMQARFDEYFPEGTVAAGGHVMPRRVIR